MLNCKLYYDFFNFNFSHFFVESLVYISPGLPRAEFPAFVSGEHQACLARIPKDCVVVALWLANLNIRTNKALPYKSAIVEVTYIYDLLCQEMKASPVGLNASDTWLRINVLNDPGVENTSLLMQQHGL